MTIPKFIQAAIEGGFNYDQKIGWGNGNNPECVYEMILNPKAWEAVWKAKGWLAQPSDTITGSYVSPEGAMINMVKVLCSGRTLEEYIATL